MTVTMETIKDLCMQNRIVLNKKMTYNFILEDGTKVAVKVTRSFITQPDSFGLIETNFGVMAATTQLYLEVPSPLNIAVHDDTNAQSQREVLRFDFDKMEDLGVGGLDDTLSQLLELIVLPRLLSAEHLEALQFQPSRGMIFHGPPGTGKTLLARKLSHVLNAHF